MGTFSLQTKARQVRGVPVGSEGEHLPFSRQQHMSMVEPRPFVHAQPGEQVVHKIAFDRVEGGGELGSEPAKRFDMLGTHIDRVQCSLQILLGLFTGLLHGRQK